MIHILAADAIHDVDLVRKAAKTGASLDWIAPKRARKGERVLFHLPGTGLAAAATIATEPRADTPGRYSAQVHEVSMLHPPAPLAFLRKHHPTWKWLTYPRSFTTIDGQIEARLEELLKSELLKKWTEDIVEGSLKTVELTRYERNRKARNQCIEHYGTSCYGCGLSFSEKYGEVADGYIQVHHLREVSARGGEYVVDPIKDLRPICPNCHAVVHLQTPPLNLRKLKQMLR